MGRYTGPVCRLCRREGKKLFLKGERCYSQKCAIEKRNVPPGQHGQTRTKQSTYGTQLREKQRTKRIYGVLERQFRRYFATAARFTGATGTTLLQLLERRLDNFVFRAGFAASRRLGRQIVRHNHILVNGQRCNIPSKRLRPGDTVSLAPGFANDVQVKNSLSRAERMGRKPWVAFNQENLSATFSSVPSREDLDDIDVREQLIVELYSK